MLNFDEINAENCVPKFQSNLFDLSRPIKIKNSKHFTPNSDNQAMFEFAKPNRAQPYTLRNPDKKGDMSLAASTNHQTAIMARLSSISNTLKSIFVRPKNTNVLHLDFYRDPKPQDFKLELSTPKDLNGRNSDTKSTCGAILTMNTKWTCMMCLSKHTMDVDVCSICGSQKTGENIKRTQRNTLKTISNQQLVNKSYLKTWTCLYCSFANDSLKIVCMNCRSGKERRHVDQVDQRVQLKRVRQRYTNTVNTINEKNGWEERVVKKSKQNKHDNTENNKICMCKCNEDKDKLNTLNNNTNENLPTPTKPVNFYTSFKQSWTCAVCLVSNDKESKNCVCCTTERELNKSDKLNVTAPVQLSLGANETAKQDEKQKKSKWKCETCLVFNDDDKTICVCCSTSRDLEQSKLTKNSSHSSITLKNTNIPFGHQTNNASTSVSFGLQTKNLSTPISFGTNFSLGGTKSGFSFKNDENKSDKLNVTAPVQLSLGANETAKQDEKQKKSKWKCETCLVFNDDDKTICVCCSTSRDLEQSKLTKNSSHSSITLKNTNISFGLQTRNVSTPIAFESNFSLGETKSGFSLKNEKNKSDKINDTITFSSVTDAPAKQGDKQEKLKWKCETCLVFNDDDKTICVCCSTSRDLGQSTKTKNSDLDSINHANRNLLFGLKTNNLSVPISFGTNFSLGETKSGFSFKNDENKSDKINDNALVHFSFGTTEPFKQTTELAADEPKEKNKINMFSMSNKSVASFYNSEPAVLDNGPKKNEQNKFNVPLENITQTPKKNNFFSFPSNATPKSSDSIFNLSSTQTKPPFSFSNNEVTKPENNFLATSTNGSKPQFSFGTSPSLLGSSSFKSTNSALFGSNSDAKPAFSFGQTKPVLFGPTNDYKKIDEDKKPSFTFGKNTETIKTNIMSPSNVNLFNTTTRPVLFGLMTEAKKTEQLTRANFRDQGEGPKATNFFNFGSNSSPVHNAPFVSSGMDEQNNFISSNLSQVLSSQAFESKRVIKKPARRLRK